MATAELKSDALMDQVKHHLSTDTGKELTKKIGLVYQINIAPKKIVSYEVVYVFDLKKGDVIKGDGKWKAGVSSRCYGGEVQCHLELSAGESMKSCYCYKIVPKEESIVASRFKHEKFAVTDSPEAPLVIATPLKVRSFSISSRR